MKIVPYRLSAALVLLATLLASSAVAVERVDLELVLLADATGSIDEGEIRLQRQGYATAIIHPQVLNAIRDGAYQKIAVTFVEWGDDNSQEVVVPWTIIDGKDSAQAFANTLMETPRRAFGFNAIGAALMAGKALIEGNEIEGFRKVIDFSGDSANNWSGLPIEIARQSVLSAGITINGLAILCRACNGRPNSYDLETAFKQLIVGGPRSFVITAEDDKSFAEAVRRKLLLEIAGTVPPDPRTAFAEGR